MTLKVLWFMSIILWHLFTDLRLVSSFLSLLAIIVCTLVLASFLYVVDLFVHIKLYTQCNFHLQWWSKWYYLFMSIEYVAVSNFFVGKFIVSYVPICGEKEYYLASACGELYVPPSAYVALYGLTVGSSFLGGKFITLSCYNCLLRDKRFYQKLWDFLCHFYTSNWRMLGCFFLAITRRKFFR